MNEPSPSHFIHQRIVHDLKTGHYATRRWSGLPGPAAQHQTAPLDSARIRTRFPPEPNGHLHFGHAKSICLNFGLAEQYGGACHLRLDDTNPETEDEVFELSIMEAVRWMGYAWQSSSGTHHYHASDYFPFLYECAHWFILQGLAYVDSQSAEQVREQRGTLSTPGIASPWRTRSIAENKSLFENMQEGKYPDGAHVLRLKIDMASPNLNMRDPTIYRIRHTAHHRTGSAWRVYPMYDYAHCISDALENISHSLCTLEFDDHRPLYDWILKHLSEGGLIQSPPPQQIEFARLNLTHTILSKRKLVLLVSEGHVSGWDDPRMPTLIGARRRGYTAEGLREFVRRIGVARADTWIDYGILEECIRDDLNQRALRRLVVLKPLRLVIDNYPEDKPTLCLIPNHPQDALRGKREVLFTRELWIEEEDFMEHPLADFFRLSPGGRVRLRYGFVIECVGVEKDQEGHIICVHAHYFPDSQSGTAGSSQYKVKGNIHWVSKQHGVSLNIRLYDRLFHTAHPGDGPSPNITASTPVSDTHLPHSASEPFLNDLNPHSLKSITAWGEPALGTAQTGEYFQFERHGYFVVDPIDSRSGALVFNRTVNLKDTRSGEQAIPTSSTPVRVKKVPPEKK